MASGAASARRYSDNRRADAAPLAVKGVPFRDTVDALLEVSPAK